MATDAVPIDLLRSSLDSLKLRFQAANDPGSPSKAWLVHVHDRGDEKPAIFARADGYNAPSVKSSPSTWSHVGVAAIVRRVPRFKRCTQLKGHQRLGPICEDAAGLLDALPTAVQHRLWRGLRDGTQLLGDGLSRWMLAVFEIGNANVTGSSLRCNRLYPITGDQAKAIFAPASGLPADADWYATLPDFAAASGQAIDILQSWLVDLPKQTTEAAGDGGGKGKRTRGKTGTGKKRGRRPATDDEIKEACEVQIDYRQKRMGKKQFCESRNGDKKVGRVGVKWLNAKLALVQKLLRESPDRIPKRFANKIKPLRRVKRAV